MKKQFIILFGLPFLLVILILLCDMATGLKNDVYQTEETVEHIAAVTIDSIQKENEEQHDLVYRGEPEVFHDLVYRGEEFAVILLSEGICEK